jgi:hypothetical protein
MRAGLVLSLLCSVAHAQPPGQTSQPAPVGQASLPAPGQPPAQVAAPYDPVQPRQQQPVAPLPPYEPAQPPPKPPPPPSIMARRWAVGLDLGGQSFTADGGDKPKVGFAALDLFVHYRIVPAFEIGAALDGGGAKYQDVELSSGGLYLDARYRLLAERPINIYVGGGLGFLAVAAKDASDAEKKGRGSLRLFVGGEWRFGAFALMAELRLVGVGENKDLPASDVVPVPIGYEMARYGLSGGALLVGALIYF